MQLGYTILYVPEVPATLKFYEAAFGMTLRFLHESGATVRRRQGALRWRFSPPPDAAAGQKSSAKATHMRSVEVMPWGQTIAYAADSNGFFVVLCTPMG